MMNRRAFTLVEMLVVIVIIGILASITLVGVNAAIISSRVTGTEAMLGSLRGAVEQYQARWGDYPPTNLTELGGKLPNEFNNGIESLTACLSSTQSGGVLFRPDKSDLYTNTDEDKADKNVNTWEFGDNQLREIADYFGRPLAYFHFKDYNTKSGALTRYKLEVKGAEQKVMPAKDPATKTFVSADKFHIISAGRDGKFGTEDDLVK